MQNSNTKQMNIHVDEMIDEVVDATSLNSHEQHFLRSRRNRDHSDRNEMRKVLKIYQKGINADSPAARTHAS